jgi:hypothetical protein
MHVAGLGCWDIGQGRRAGCRSCQRRWRWVLVGGRVARNWRAAVGALDDPNLALGFSDFQL